MELLKEWGFQALALDDLVARLASADPTPSRHVVLTFDDGCGCFRREAAAVLLELGFTASVFVPVGHIGLTAAWDTPKQACCERLLSWAEIEELSRAGFSFYPHGLTHRRLVELAEEELGRELRDPHSALEARLGKPAQVFCYPYGEASSKVRAAVRSAGYRAACGLEIGLNRRAGHLWDLRRMLVLRTTTLRGFRARATGAFSYYAGIRRFIRGGGRRPNGG
jgi:peptidoglycan/xylan/chitin deacetylase (PgdA/CDA1 family)